MKVVWETTDKSSGMDVANANEGGATQNRPPICFTSRLFLLWSSNETPFQCGPSIDIAFGVHNDNFFAYHRCSFGFGDPVLLMLWLLFTCYRRARETRSHFTSVATRHYYVRYQKST
jgi:hypothetical protein